MFRRVIAKRHGMLKLFGWSKSNRPRPRHDTRSSFARHKARECKIIAQRWDALALQAETAHQRELHQRIANGWRELAGG